ncbi:MAG: helix-turn-helix transcriptional regulator, partial [Candidatus Thorarchaeota archaeon]|nr:helix-turn-helix transcriptional regulator [Candidatus Thorarchaeota archaeon]
MKPTQYLEIRNRSIKSRIKKARQRHGLTQQHVADAVGCSRSRIAHIENLDDPTIFTISEAELFANLIGVHPTQFLQLSHDDALNLSRLPFMNNQSIFSKQLICELPDDVQQFMDNSPYFAPRVHASPSGKTLCCWVDSSVEVEEVFYFDENKGSNYPYNILLWDSRSGKLISRISIRHLESIEILSDDLLLTHQLIKEKSIFTFHNIKRAKSQKSLELPQVGQYTLNSSHSQMAVYYDEAAIVQVWDLETIQPINAYQINYVPFETISAQQLREPTIDLNNLPPNPGTMRRWESARKLPILKFDRFDQLEIGTHKSSFIYGNHEQYSKMIREEGRYEDSVDYIPYRPDDKKTLDGYRIGYKIEKRNYRIDRLNTDVVNLHLTLPKPLDKEYDNPRIPRHVETSQYVTGFIREVHLIDKHCILALVTNNLPHQYGISYLERLRLINLVNQRSTMIPTDRDTTIPFEEIHQDGACLSPNNDYVAFWLTT